MKESQIFATSLLIAFPATMIFFGSHAGPNGLDSIALDCNDAKTREVMAPATRSAPDVAIDCNLRLTRRDTVTKRMKFHGTSANGVTVDCNGATINGGVGSFNYRHRDSLDMIDVRSIPEVEGETWKRPQNITIRNCAIIGSVMISIGWIPPRYTKRVGYVDRIRNNAPTNIVLDHVTVTGIAGDIVYFGGGVTYSQLVNSEIRGTSTGVPLYLDAESYRNTIKNNKFNMVTTGREVMAVDGSSYNTIIDNWFSGIDHGGIYLYRNCGEGGRVRHSTPSHNYIVNNVFYYKTHISAKKFPVYLGARNEDDYCDADKDPSFPYGSSLSDLDYARYNVVMQNRIFKSSSFPYYNQIKINTDPANSPNYLGYNVFVTEAPDRLAGCYVSENGYKRDFVLHGETIEVLEVGRGQPASYNHTCNDGRLTRTSQNSRVTRLVFDCGPVDGNNDGCNTSISARPGQKIVGATAACNLEQGTISEEILGRVPTNNIAVIRASDRVLDGSCYVGNNKLQRGQETITGVDGLTRVPIGCREHDSNGGDCHIKVILYTR